MSYKAVAIDMTDTATVTGSAKTVAVVAINPIEEETTEGFVIDVLEGDDDKTKPQEISAAEAVNLNDPEDMTTRRTEEHLEETLCTKIKDILSWMVIAFLACLLVGILIWHYTK